MQCFLSSGILLPVKSLFDWGYTGMQFFFSIPESVRFHSGGIPIGRICYPALVGEDIVSVKGGPLVISARISCLQTLVISLQVVGLVMQKFHCFFLAF